MNNELGRCARNCCCTNVRHCYVALEEVMQTEFRQGSISGSRFEPDPPPPHPTPNTKQVQCNPFHRVVFARTINLFPLLWQFAAAQCPFCALRCFAYWFWDATDISYGGCSLYKVLHFVIQPQPLSTHCAALCHTASNLSVHTVLHFVTQPSLLLYSVLQFTILSHLSLCTVFSLPLSQAFQYTMLQFSTSLQPSNKQCIAFCHILQPTATQSVVCRSSCSTWWTSYAFFTPPMCWPPCHWDI
jgi:hypothetical protein